MTGGGREITTGGVGINDLIPGFKHLTLSEKQTLFFGAPSIQPKSTPDEEYTVDYRTGSYATIGQSHHIRRILIKKIQDTDDVIARHALPRRSLPHGNKITVTELTFKDTVLDDIPDLGTGRLTSQSMRAWTVGIARRGLAFFMDDGLAVTDIGAEQYLMNIQQLSTATSDSMSLDGYHELLNAPLALANTTGNKSYYQQFGITHSGCTRNDLFNAEKRLWSILTKTKYGFWIMQQEARKVFATRRVTPDTLILSNGSRDYMKYNREETIRYDHFGSRGVDAFLGSGYIQRLNDIDIFESTLYNTRDSELPECPLSRQRTIGEFGDSLHKDNTRGLPNMGKYLSVLRQRTIHDNFTDTMKTLTLQSLFDADGLFDLETGEPTEHTGRPYFSGYRSIGSFLKAHGMWKDVSDCVRTRKAVERDAMTEAFNAVPNTPVVVAVESDEDAAAAADDAAAAPTGTRGKRSVRVNDDMGLHSDMEDEDGGSSAGSGGHVRRAKQTRETRHYFNHKPDKVPQKDRERYELSSLTVSGGAMSGSASSGKDLSPIFADFAETGRFTRAHIQQLALALLEDNALRTTDEFVKIPYVVFLRAIFAKRSKQDELYIMPNMTAKEVKTFLNNLYTELTPETVETGGFQRATDQAKTGGEFYRSAQTLSKKGSKPPKNSGTSSEQLTTTDRKLISVYSRRIPEINQYVPSFLPGAYAWLRQLHPAEGIDSVEKHMESVMDFAAWIVKHMKRSSDGQANPATEWVKVLRDVDDADTFKKVLGTWDSSKGTRAKMSYDEITGNKQEKLSFKSGGSVSDADFFDRMPIKRQYFDLFIEYNLPFPIDYTFVRPSMMYECGSAIMMKSGAETGATFFGDADFQLSNDGNRKALYGFFTCRCGACVYAPRNVHVLYNVRCHRYLGGGGVELFDNGNDVEVEDYKNGEPGSDKSIFVIPMYPGELVNRGQTVFDITGFFPEEAEGISSDGRSPMPHYQMAQVMTARWGWQRRINYLDIEFYAEESNYNTTVFRMTQFQPRFKNGFIEETGAYKPGDGHWGPNVYAGVREDRCGLGRGAVRDVNFSAEAAACA